MDKMNVRLLKSFICRFIPSPILRYYDNWKIRERRKSYGKDNPDKIFYIIGYTDVRAGLFWIVNKALMHLDYAENNGYISVVDYKNNDTQYTGKCEHGVVNVWEKYFKQPCGYSLDDIQRSKNIIIARKCENPCSVFWFGPNFYYEPNIVERARRVYRKYISYSDEVKAYLCECENLLKGKGKVLGVLCRGTDYVTLKPAGHPIPMSLDFAIEKAKEVMADKSCDCLFLATEDEDVYQRFLQEFGDKLIVNHQQRTSKSQLKRGQFLSESRMEQVKSANERFVSGLEYLAAIHLLSKCNCLVADRCNGTKVALIMSEGFEYKFIFNGGMYE
jgi:hypothetical protein